MSLSPQPRPVYVEPPNDDRLVPPRWLDQAPVTRSLLALNVAMFLVQSALTRLVTDLSSRAALALGASYAFATVGEHRWETLVTACFLHGGIIHLAFNMVALWQAGPIVERAVGSARMAPLYLVAGALGNALSVAHGWLAGEEGFTVGASGAIMGVIAAALVVGWRVQGWRGPLTQAMARWLGFVAVFGALSGMTGGRVDNAAHLGGAIAGAAIATTWRRGLRYSARATVAIVAGCAAVLVACIAVVAAHDREDRFATMTVQDRAQLTAVALASGRCRDAYQGLLALERLRPASPLSRSLREEVEATCGRLVD